MQTTKENKLSWNKKEEEFQKSFHARYINKTKHFADVMSSPTGSKWRCAQRISTEYTENDGDAGF